MAQLTVVKRDGTSEQFDAPNGYTVMEAIRDQGIDELLAICGGCCSCATCHVHVDARLTGRLAAASADEADLLDSEEERSALSRLACQLIVDAHFEGMRFIVAHVP